MSRTSMQRPTVDAPAVQVPKDTARLSRFRALMTVYQQADSIIAAKTLRTTLAHDPKEAAPAWTNDTGSVITFNLATLGDIATRRDYIRVTAINYHELSHVLFTPAKGGRTAYNALYARASRSNKDGEEFLAAFIALEDQRIESMMVTRAPAVRAYFETAIADYVLANEEIAPYVFLLVYGRKYLGEEIIEAARAKWGYAPELLDQAADIIDRFRVLDLTNSMHLLSAVSLGVQFMELLRKINPPTPPSLPHGGKDHGGCQDTDQGDQQKSKQAQAKVEDGVDQPKRAPKPQAKNEIDGGKPDKKPSKSSEDQQSDGDQEKDEDEPESQPEGETPGDDNDQGDDQGEDGKDGGSGDEEGEDESDGAGQGDQPGSDPGQDEGQDGEGQNDGSIGIQLSQGEQGDPGDIPGQGAGSETAEHDAGTSLDELIEALATSSGESMMVESDYATFRATVKAGRMIESLTTYRHWGTGAAPGATALTNRIAAELRRLVEQEDPGWVYREPQGRMNVGRYALGERDMDALFDSWEEGNADATSIEAVILVDISGSMDHSQAELSGACWTIKRSFDLIDAPCTVIAYDAAGFYVYRRDERASTVRFPSFNCVGGTDASQALQEAYSILSASSKLKKYLFTMTDGSWYSPAVAYLGGSAGITSDDIVELVNKIPRTVTHMVYFDPYTPDPEDEDDDDYEPPAVNWHNHKVRHRISDIGDLPKIVRGGIAALIAARR